MINFFQSIDYNLTRTFNLLGEYGVMGPRREVKDPRDEHAQIFYGLMSAPFVIVFAAVTNTVDSICSFTKNFFMSFAYNLERTFNLLGDYGVMGKHHGVTDTRDEPARKYFYGIISAPFVAVFAAVTNTVDAVCAFAKNFYLSFAYNLERTFNLLGDYGVMGKHHEVTDTRDKPAQIFLWHHICTIRRCFCRCD